MENVKDRTPVMSTEIRVQKRRVYAHLTQAPSSGGSILPGFQAISLKTGERMLD